MNSRRVRGIVAVLSCAVTTAVLSAAPVASTDWPAYGRTPGGDRHSPLTEITPQNVAQLRLVWRYHTHETQPEFATRRLTRLEVTPLVIGDTMFISTPLGRVVALDARNGTQRWSFDAAIDRSEDYGDFVNRGVSYWRDAQATAGAACASRIFLAAVDATLIALDALTGRPCEGFGNAGRLDLRQGLRNPPDFVAEYEQTSPPAVSGDLVIVGSAVADNSRTTAASGEVRAYDARSGVLRWTFDPVPQDRQDPAWSSWGGADAHRTGAANTWSVIAAEPEQDRVYLPTSSPSVDYWGGSRLGSNRYANSVVALRASTGERLWSFQTVHHDLWDYDNAAPPALIDVRMRGRVVAALAQATKSGQLFILDRRTGRPLFPVREMAVPRSDVPGEVAWPTQPQSSLPALSPTRLTAQQVWGPTPAAKTACEQRLATLRNDGPFTPPSERGSLVYPSNVGGAHWGGVTFDPQRQLLIVPTNRIASIVSLIPRAQIETARAQDRGHSRLGLEYTNMRGTPYWLRREFFAVDGVPCTAPPFGALHAIDLKTGRTAWDVPLGTAAQGSIQGMLNLGGPVSTASGLVFIGAAPDGFLRAFDTATGRELWKAQLPAGARATPMTYQASDGHQYVAIAAGGDGEFFGRGDEIQVFALTQDTAH